MYARSFSTTTRGRALQIGRYDQPTPVSRRNAENCAPNQAVVTFRQTHPFKRFDEVGQPRQTAPHTIDDAHNETPTAVLRYVRTHGDRLATQALTEWQDDAALPLMYSCAVAEESRGTFGRRGS